MNDNILIGRISSVNAFDNLIGNIESSRALVGCLPAHPQKIIGRLTSGAQSLIGSITFARSIPDKYYEGDYEVVPAVDPQTLPTKQTYLSDDVQVTSIPYFDVSNTSGGSTVYIGTQIEIK